MASMPIYLDNHATTRVDPRVVDAMMPYFVEQFGNPASVSHAYGWEAKDAVERATETIASAIGARPKEIVFTSGATESNNLAIRGVAEQPRNNGRHLISVATEHKAVLDPLANFVKRGFEVTLLDVEQDGSPRAGYLDPARVAEAICEDTVLVSVMLANNEIGVIQPLAEIGDICRQRGVPLHCDATQAVGKIVVDVEALNIDLMSFSGHKIYGPKGIGALYVRRRRPTIRLEPQLTGGGHQGGLRSGTLNTPGIVGLATAIEICKQEMATEQSRLAALREQLFTGLTEALTGVTLCGPGLSESCADGAPLRLPGNLVVSFDLVDGEALLMSMGGLAVSSGAACTSADPQPSHVLRALGIDEDRTRSSLRFGLGRFNTASEVESAISMVAESVDRLRKMSSLTST